MKYKKVLYVNAKSLRLSDQLCMIDVSLYIIQTIHRCQLCFYFNEKKKRLLDEALLFPGNAIDLQLPLD